ncbi:hypothetical protein Bamb_6229 [Burkholderia ambifaria AMMD]|uniref:Uncharacterized protein n=1 Tax=Burkholderia ambifaria (strain ATCC BAA-244 / DSM 16087 / CCUG 44356 / LMG 19182 / AMMD) TaxID=339670 RepID=Q0B250_BURCM|nr:hypothetical protein Bamb_6229 [Burkholderia ambifaria AMMD]
MECLPKPRGQSSTDVVDSRHVLIGSVQHRTATCIPKVNICDRFDLNGIASASLHNRSKIFTRHASTLRQSMSEFENTRPIRP